MALKDKLMTLEDFKAVRDVDVASNSAQFTEIKADLTKLADITPIPDNSDLNNYTETGLYTIEYGNYTILHYPTDTVATSYLEVRALTTGYIVQKLTKGNGDVFIRRRYSNGNWTDWVQIARDISTAQVFTDEIKAALLACFENVAYTNGQGQTYYNNLLKALSLTTYPGIAVVFDSKGNDIYDTDSLESLKEYLTVTYYTSKNDNGLIISANDYNLSGSLNTGKNTITVTYSGVQSSFSVNVVEMPQTITFAPNYNFTNNNNATPNAYAQYHSSGRQAFAATGSTLPKFKQTLAGTDSGVFTNDSPYSAIKFPKGKTSVTVTCSSNYRCNINWYSLSSNGYYELETISGWQTAGRSFTFNKTNYEYFVIIFDSGDNTTSNYSLRFN